MSQKITDHYRELLAKYGDSAAAAQWSSRESQFRRFAALARIGDLRDKRVLDFGCGTGTLHDYLVSVGQTPALYHGCDIMSEFFDIARQKIPRGQFCHPDALGDARFDYVFVSGVFNNRKRGNRKFWQKSIRSLFARSDIALAFNMMSTYVDYRDPALYYEDPAQAFTFVKREVTPFVALNHDYLPKLGSVGFEFTIFAYRDHCELCL